MLSRDSIRHLQRSKPTEGCSCRKHARNHARSAIHPCGKDLLERLFPNCKQRTQLPALLYCRIPPTLRKGVSFTALGRAWKGPTFLYSGAHSALSAGLLAANLDASTCSSPFWQQNPAGSSFGQKVASAVIDTARSGP